MTQQQTAQQQVQTVDQAHQALSVASQAFNAAIADDCQAMWQQAHDLANQAWHVVQQVVTTTETEAMLLDSQIVLANTLMAETAIELKTGAMANA